MRKGLACLGLLLVALLGLAGCGAQAPAPSAAAPTVQPAPAVQSTPPPSPTVTPPQQPQSVPVAPQPKPGYTVWAVDPGGSKPAEVLAQGDQPLTPLASSPDGRYLLLGDEVGMAPHDHTMILHLLDRKTGELRQGPKNWVRTEAVAWSGNGFWVDWLDHVDVNLKLTHKDALAKNLGVDKDHPLIAFATTPDRKHLAAVLGGGAGKSADLLLADGDGAHLHRVPAALTPLSYDSGDYAPLALSPDGDLLLVIADTPTAALIHTASPDPKNWQVLPGEWGLPAWAPDGQHVWMPRKGILDRSGKVVVPLGNPDGQWLPNGTLLTGGTIIGLDGVAHALPNLPASSWPIGFLTDGRWLISQVVRH